MNKEQYHELKAAIKLNSYNYNSINPSSRWINIDILFSLLEDFVE